MIKNINNFLSIFGTPGVRCIYEKGDKKNKVSTNTVLSTEQILEYNNSGYGAFFTPNGNYGHGKKIGDKLTIKKGLGDGINCFWVDLDFDDTLSYEDKIKYIRDVCKKYNIGFSFAVETGRGFHLYWMIEDEDKNKVTIEDYKKITKFLNETIFEQWGDPSNIHEAKLLRIPFTYRWKKGKRQVKLLNSKLEYVENVSKDFIESIPRLNIDNINVTLKYIADSSIVKKTTTEGKVKIGDIKIQFSELFDKLKKYPKIYNNRKYYFKMSSNGKIIIVYIDNGREEEYMPDGYFVNIRENYVNNFSSIYHTIVERPRGGIVPFLYYYFDKNWGLVKKFLKDEFGIEFEEETIFDIEYIQNNGEIVWESENGTQTIYYIPKKGIYKIAIVKDTISVKTLLKANIEFVSINEISRELILGTTLQNKKKVYFCKHNGEDIVLEHKSAKRTFNDNYGVYGLRWLGSDDELLHLYNWLDDNESLYNKIKVYENSGYYDDGTIIFGDKIIKGESDNTYIVSVRKVRLLDISNKREISLKDYAKLYGQLWKNGEYIFTLFLTLFGMNKIINYRNKRAYVGTNVGIFGDTKVGKTTTFVKFFEALGIDHKSITRSSKSTTDQPIKTFATEYCPGVLEEFTGEHVSKKEDLFRDIMSGNVSERGNTKYNTTFIFRSPLIILGESEPESESVINRLGLIILKYEDVVNNIKLSELDKYSIKQEVFNFWSNLEIDENKMCSITDKIKEFGYDSRFADTYSLFAYVGEQSGIISVDEMCKIGGNMYNRIGISVSNQRKETNLLGLLDRYITIFKIKNQVSISRYIRDDKDNSEIIEITFFGKGVLNNTRHFTGLKEYGFEIDIDRYMETVTIKYDTLKNKDRETNKGIIMFFDNIILKNKKIVNEIPYI